MNSANSLQTSSLSEHLFEKLKHVFIEEVFEYSRYITTDNLPNVYELLKEGPAVTDTSISLQLTFFNLLSCQGSGLFTGLARLGP